MEEMYRQYRRKHKEEQALLEMGELLVTLRSSRLHTCPK
jgi:hypothetical protein